MGGGEGEAKAPLARGRAGSQPVRRGLRATQADDHELGRDVGDVVPSGFDFVPALQGRVSASELRARTGERGEIDAEQGGRAEDADTQKFGAHSELKIERLKIERMKETERSDHSAYLIGR